MKKFNIGDKVVPISKSVCGSLGSSNVWRRAQEKNQGFIYVNHYEKNGDITCNDELVDYNSGDYFTESDLVLYSENIVNSVNIQKLIDTLETIVGEANVAIETLKGYQTQESIPETEVEIETTNARQQIINEAKEFVKKYGAVRENSGSSHTIGNMTAQEHYYEAGFITKGNKITALVHHLNFGKTKQSNKPNRVGRAECAPDNVFNKHIGEAIALGRALDINVDKFINAVQPTEFVVGQVVKGKYEPKTDFYSSDKIFTLTKMLDGGSFRYKEREGDYIINKQIGQIVDDTNAQYEGSEQ